MPTTAYRIIIDGKTVSEQHTKRLHELMKNLFDKMGYEYEVEIIDLTEKIV